MILFLLFVNVRVRGTGNNLLPVSTTPAVQVTKFAASIVDTGGKYAGVVDTGGKFAAGVVDAGGKLGISVVDTGGAPSLGKFLPIFGKI
jgi:hypothetical protein